MTSPSDIKGLVEALQRSGFGTEELDMFIPGWRDELSDLTAMKARAEAAESSRDDYRRQLEEAKDLMDGERLLHTSTEAQLQSQLEEAKGLVESVLIDAAQIIDTAKREWAAEGQWSEWDQGVRDRILQALASISSREEDEDEGITQLEDDPRVQEALRYLEARNFVLVNRQSDDPTPVRQLIADRLSAPSTQAEREAVERLRRELHYRTQQGHDESTPYGDVAQVLTVDLRAILSLLESRRTTPDPHPLTALLTRWDNGESVGDLITQYLRGEGDWGPVRVLVGSLGSVACSAEPSLASRVSDNGPATPSGGE